MKEVCTYGISAYLSERSGEVCAAYRERVLSAGSAASLWSMLDCSVADWLVLQQDRRGDCAAWVASNFREFSGREVLRGEYSAVLFAGEGGTVRQSYESLVVLCGCSCTLEVRTPCIVYAVGSTVLIESPSSVKVRRSTDSEVRFGGEVAV